MRNTLRDLEMLTEDAVDQVGSTIEYLYLYQLASVTVPSRFILGALAQDRTAWSVRAPDESD